MFRLFTVLFLTSFLVSCNAGVYFKGFIRTIKRSILPASCQVDIKLDTSGLEYMEDLWDYEFQISEETNFTEFADAVQLTPNTQVSGANRDWSSTRFSLSYWNLSPGVEYKIKVGKFFSENDCLHSADASDSEYSIPALKVKPHFSLSRQNIFESDQNKILPVYVNNINELNVKTAELSTQALLEALSSKGRLYYESNSGLNWKKSKWKPDLKYNLYSNQGMPLEPYFPKANQGKGWIALSLGANVIGDKNQEEYKTESIFLQSTNLGITSKSDQEAIHVWVHTLSKAEPVQNAQMTLYENGLNRGTCLTDNQGHCVLPALNEKSSLEKSVIIAEHEPSKDKAFLHFYETESDDYYYDDGDYETTNVKGKIFFDRKLYRPGDQVEIKAILAERKINGLVPFAGKKAIIAIRDSEGREITSQTLNTSAQGGVYLSHKIDTDASLGHYNVSINLNDKDGYITSDSFQVEEFRPVNFLVNVKLPKEGIKDKKLNAIVEGRYLFGAPMVGAKYTYSLLRRNRSVYFDEYPDFRFSQSYYDYEDEYGSSRSDYVSGSEGKLGEKGYAEIEIPLTGLEEKFSTKDEDIQILNPLTLLVESSVQDVDGKSVSKSASIPYSPSSHFVGLSAKDRYQAMDKPFQFKVISVGSDKKLQAGKDLTAYIIYNDWTSVLSKGIGKFFFRSNQLEKKIVKTIKLKSELQPKPFEYRAEDSGSYTLLVVNGDKMYSRMDFYAYEKESYYTWDFRSDDSIELRSDKNEYDIGDQAKILIKSPLQNARAIVTIEREKVFETRTLTMKGNSVPLELKIEDAHLPNVKVHVLLLSGRMAAPKDASAEDLKTFLSEDLGAPKAKTGSITLKVNLKTKISELSIKTDKEEYKPGEVVKLSIQTEPNAELTVSVADRGVLDLVGYSYSNPIQIFYQYWNSWVKSFESRTMVIRQYLYENKGDSPGGDYGEESGGGFSVDSESGARKDFRDTAYWNPSAVANSSGKAELSFTLPDNLTTFRVMVVSANQGKFNAGNEEFIVKKSLVLQKTVARFIRVGDELELGGSITNNTKINASFKYKIESPFLQEKSEWQILKLNGGETKEVLRKFVITEQEFTKRKKMANGGEVNVSFTMYVEPNQMDVFPNLKKSDLSDALQVTIPVKDFEPVTSYQTASYTDQEYNANVPLPSEKVTSFYNGNISFRLSATALTGLKNAFDFFETNPYFCMEQRTSAYLLSISAGELLREFDYKVPPGEYYDFKQIEKIFLDEMTKFQVSDGSFRLWKDGYGSRGYPYLTAYVLYGMLLGKEKGKRINQEAYQAGLKYLNEYIKNPTETKKASWQTMALIYEVLSRDGQNVTLIEKTLLDNFTDLNLKSKGIFLLRYAKNHNLQNKETDAIFAGKFKEYASKFTWDKDMIKLNLEDRNLYDYSYYNTASTLAYYLRLLIQIDTNNPKIPDLVKDILLSKQEAYWMDSHSVANLAIALSEYRNRFEATDSQTSALVVLAGDKIIQESFSSNSDRLFKLDLPFEKITNQGTSSQKPLQIKRTSDLGRIYFQTRVFYTPLKDKTQKKEQGLKIQKTIYKIKGRDDDGNPVLEEAKGFTRGNMYLVELVVNSDEVRSFVMITDPIPSSTEVINSSFLTESAEVAEAVDVTEDSWYGGNQEYRDDRVLFSRDYLRKGETKFRYLLRPVAKGNVSMPASKAFMMYRPNIFGNTSTINLKSE
ncbi:alpha-2-macroglobulin family protein [Leptospira ryugenii]|uniref:Alpha-2-macroglobulin family protein n=1 Tax=Leptospira ryugenii TaxID=1917863 RepID=A0A2P2E1U4_9LEPT|nr:MG2 domain-containing protein [Leptospira ryugenii]GBF50875.1 alpha-2-macroglobulin family protein [Leptospira ryugenii]